MATDRDRTQLHAELYVQGECTDQPKSCIAFANSLWRTHWTDTGSFNPVRQVRPVSQTHGG